MRTKSIQAKLFYNYSLLIIVVVTVIVVSFYFYISGILQKKASESLFQQSSHISTEFDSQITNMNAISTKILFSEPIHELFYSPMFQVDKSSIDRQRQFNNIIYPIIGYDKTFRQINMFRVTGEFASIGDNFRFSVLPAARIATTPWVADTLRLNGTREISLPHPDNWNSGDQIVISLSRAFAPAWNEKVDSILEVQQDYGVFTRIIDNASAHQDAKTDKDIRIYVLDEQGRLVYPIDSQAEAATAQTYWKRVKERLNSQAGAKSIDTSGENRAIISYSVSDLSGWTVIAAESKSWLLAPVNTFRNAILVLGILTLFVTLAISYLVSRSLTIPIKHVHKSIKLLSLNTLPPKPAVNVPARLNELEHLNLAFIDMRLRLQQSLDEAIVSREHELEAHKFALQAQMNPHFLYNTITNISILAEDQGQTAIVGCCEQLSRMLRYISSSDAAPVSLSEELDHASDYLNLMKLRYEDNIQFSFEVPAALQRVEVPKLIVQPIVENAIKYGIHVDPPWIIAITGTLFEDRWELDVRDNGHGFGAERLAELRNQLATTDPTVRIPSLRINGMGLLNIYTRLKLLFGSRFAMNVSDHPEGGALVTLIVYHETGGTAR